MSKLKQTQAFTKWMALYGFPLECYDLPPYKAQAIRMALRKAYLRGVKHGKAEK